MKNGYGFTMVEVLIAGAVSALTGILLVSILVQNNGLFSQQNAQITQGVNLNNTSSQIDELLRSASSIVSSNPIGNPTYTTGAQTLVVALPSYDGSGNIISNTFDYGIVTVDAQNSTLLRKIIFKDASSNRTAENRILASKLTLLKFTYFDDNGNIVSPTASTKVNFIINLDEKAGYSSKQSSASGQTSLRNN